MDTVASVFNTKSSLGALLVVATKNGLVEIKSRQKTRLKINTNNKHVKIFCNWLKGYLQGKEVKFKGALDLSWANTFDKKVYKKLMNIKYGRIVAYVDIAKAIGNPKASRAVGNSLAKNKLPIIIPCHRVISSNGSLGGYSGGLGVKKFLLQLEKAI